MKINKIIPWILLLALMACGWGVYSYWTKNTDLKKKISEHEETIATLRGMTDSINFELAQALEANAKKQADLDKETAAHRHDQEVAHHAKTEADAKIKLLETEVEPIIQANPKLREYVEALKASATAAEVECAATAEERDAWILKYNVKDADFRAAMKAKIDTERALEQSLFAYQSCVNDLSAANKQIRRQRLTGKVLTVVGVVEAAILGGTVIGGLAK